MTHNLSGAALLVFAAWGCGTTGSDAPRNGEGGEERRGGSTGTGTGTGTPSELRGFGARGAAGRKLERVQTDRARRGGDRHRADDSGVADGGGIAREGPTNTRHHTDPLRGADQGTSLVWQQRDGIGATPRAPDRSADEAGPPPEVEAPKRDALVAPIGRWEFRVARDDFLDAYRPQSGWVDIDAVDGVPGR